MKVKSLFIYPVKSFSGIELFNEMEIDHKGPKYDRRFMVVDSEGKFITQRDFPQMALIKTKIDKEGSLSILLPNNDTKWLFARNQQQGEIIEANVWRHHGPVIKQNSEVSDALSDFLQKKVFLVHMPDHFFREVNTEFTPDNGKYDVSLADGYPFLLATESSFNNLKEYLGLDIKMNRFRPNIVISGDLPPFDEQKVKNLTIGNIPFAVAKPCPRCQIINTNQEEGVKDLNLLKVLGNKQKDLGGKGADFGIYLIQLRNGVIKVGDEIKWNN